MSHSKIHKRSNGACNLLSNNANNPIRCAVPCDVMCACDLKPHKKKSQQDKNRFFSQKSREAAEKRENDFAERELESMFPFRHYGKKLCDPVENYYSKPNLNFDELHENKICLVKSSELEHDLQERYNSFRNSYASDKANLGIMLNDFKKQYPDAYRISNALPHLPFPWLEKPNEGYKDVTNHLYKTTTQLAFEVSPFDKNIFTEQYYPLATLEKSADQFFIPNYKQVVVGNARRNPSPSNEDGKDKARKIAVSDCIESARPLLDSLKRSGLQSSSKVEDSANDLRQCQNSSVMQHRRMQIAAFKGELAKRHEAEISGRMNDPPCDLLGTYVGRIGTAVPPNWQPRDPPTEVERVNNENTIWERATNLPKPTCLCCHRCTVAEHECA